MKKYICPQCEVISLESSEYVLAGAGSKDIIQSEDTVHGGNGGLAPRRPYDDIWSSGHITSERHSEIW